MKPFEVGGGQRWDPSAMGSGARTSTGSAPSNPTRTPRHEARRRLGVSTVPVNPDDRDVAAARGTIGIVLAILGAFAFVFAGGLVAGWPLTVGALVAARAGATTVPPHAKPASVGYAYGLGGVAVAVGMVMTLIVIIRVANS